MIFLIEKHKRSRKRKSKLLICSRNLNNKLNNKLMSSMIRKTTASITQANKLILMIKKLKIDGVDILEQWALML